jgi:hypothetical protein
MGSSWCEDTRRPQWCNMNVILVEGYAVGASVCIREVRHPSVCRYVDVPGVWSRVIPQSVQANAGTVAGLIYERVVPNLFSYHS